MRESGRRSWRIKLLAGAWRCTILNVGRLIENKTTRWSARWLDSVKGKLAFWGLIGALSGCASPKINPSMPVSSAEAREILRKIDRQPMHLPRPLVVVSGFNDLGVPSKFLAPRFRRTFRDQRVVDVSFFGCRTFDACAKRLVAAVQAKFPSESADQTVEVDVVAMSMGGLVSRYAAIPQPGRRHLKISRLFTISSPHQGANLAKLPTFQATQIDMRHGSPFLRRLDAAGRAYEIFPYVRLGDVIVGAKNAAPVGEVPWWLPSETVIPAHAFAFADDRIFLDIVLRLRDEPPTATLPRAALPSK